MDSVTNGKLSITKASKQYSIPKGSLVNRLHGKHPLKMGRPRVFGDDEEQILVQKIALCARFGFPLNRKDIRLVIKSYVDSTGRDIPQLQSNMPGEDWVRSFLERHKSTLSERIANNIKRTRAEVDNEILSEYHKELVNELQMCQLQTYLIMMKRIWQILQAK